jgi:transposase
LLIAFYPARPDRPFCEQLDYNLLFRWFLDLDVVSGGLDQSNFSRLRERLVETDLARRFFDEVVRLARTHRRPPTACPCPASQDSSQDLGG